MLYFTLRQVLEGAMEGLKVSVNAIVVSLVVVMSHDMMTLTSPFALPTPLPTALLSIFWSSRPPMTSPWSRTLQPRHAPPPPSTDKPPTGKPPLRSPNTRSPLPLRPALTPPTNALLLHVFPHPLLDKMCVPLSSSKPPLSRQHCLSSSLLVTSATSRHFTRSHHFSSPPSAFCPSYPLTTMPTHHRQPKPGLSLSHQFGDDVPFFWGHWSRILHRVSHYFVRQIIGLAALPMTCKGSGMSWGEEYQ
jgi:hypothetical protein